MRTSDAIDQLSAALAAAQAEIRPALKDANNPAFNSKYADIGAVFEAARGPLAKYGLSVVQMPEHSDDALLHLTTRICHKSGQWIEGTMSIPVGKVNAHGYGSAITYARRYAYSAALGIVADEDDDGNKASESKPTKVGALPRAIPANVEGQETFEAYDADTKEWLRTHADTVERMHKEGRDADMVGYVNKQEFDTETKLALWWILPSGVRSAFKKASKEVREMESAA